LRAIFKTVTINILSDLSRWEERRQVLVAGLAEIRPDLIALQEVSLQIRNANWLAEQLDIPNIHISQKTGNSSENEGIAILSRLPVEEQATLDLITQGRVAQYVQVRLDGRSLVFANCHLYWQPGDSEERTEQVERMLDWLEAIPGNPALVICGDFNATPESSSVQRMKARRYHSTYAIAHGREPDYTSPTPLPRSKRFLLRTLFRYLSDVSLKDFSPTWRGTLDYIFVNNALHVKNCRLALDRPAASNPKLYASDHFGLVAELEIEREKVK
jgi:endonuclease/exonuclease/phosphatase family metal-dependent hydrolase